MDSAPRLLKKRWALAAIFFGMLAGMTVFEVTKQMIIPAISIWESHVITIIFTSIMGVVIAYYPLQAMQLETQRATSELRLRTVTEERLRTSEAQIRSFVDSTESSIYTVDREGRYLMMNRQHMNRLNVPGGNIEGYVYSDFHTPKDSEHFLSCIHRVASENSPYAEEFGKGEKTFLRQFNPVNDPRTGNVIAITVISQEITEQKRTERAILEANRKLNLLSDITRHDILNQLLVLSGYVTLLQGRKSSLEEQQFLSRCETAVNTIQSQITFTRDYQDIGIQAPEWQNIGEILEGVQERLTLGNVTLTDATENVGILADHLLEKVFYNLVDNSLRYAGPGLTSIRVSTERKLADGSLHIVYSDNGVGIAESDRSRLFERGFGKHTGLGLFLSREILSITGITITENGSPGTGVRFEIIVPKGGFRFSRTEYEAK